MQPPWQSQGSTGAFGEAHGIDLMEEFLIFKACGCGEIERLFSLCLTQIFAFLVQRRSEHMPCAPPPERCTTCFGVTQGHCRASAPACPGCSRPKAARCWQESGRLCFGKVMVCSSTCIRPFQGQIFEAYGSSYAAQIHLPALPWGKQLSVQSPAAQAGTSPSYSREAQLPGDLVLGKAGLSRRKKDMLDIYVCWKRNVRATKENPDVLHSHGSRLIGDSPT